MVGSWIICSRHCHLYCRVYLHEKVKILVSAKTGRAESNYKKEGFLTIKLFFMAHFVTLCKKSQFFFKHTHQGSIYRNSAKGEKGGSYIYKKVQKIDPLPIQYVHKICTHYHTKPTQTYTPTSYMVGVPPPTNPSGWDKKYLKPQQHTPHRGLT